MLEVAKRIGRNIKRIRTQKTMSQGDICRKLYMDRGYISSVENGKKNITIATLDKLANALNVPVYELLK